MSVYFDVVVSIVGLVVGIFCVLATSEVSGAVCVCDCHGAHTREEQEHADEDINSNNNL